MSPDSPCERSPKVIALMLSEERMASLSAREGSSPAATLADRMTHMSHRFTLTDLRSARLRGEPWTLISACKFTDNYSYVENGDFG